MCMSLFISPRPEISIHSDFVFSWRQTVHFTFHPDSVKRTRMQSSYGRAKDERARERKCRNSLLKPRMRSSSHPFS
jgi:hypothetical protein